MPLVASLKSLLNKHTTTSPTSSSSKHSSPDPQSSSSAAPLPPAPKQSVFIEPTPPTPSPSTVNMAGASRSNPPVPTSTTPTAGSKTQAELLVRLENEARAKRDQATYVGLPAGLTLGVKMGDGAFSNVFSASLRLTAAQLAIDPTLGDGKTVDVAVKCVRKYELSYSQGLAGKRTGGEATKKKPRVTERANILKEVQIMRGLDHPNIVRLLNFAESEDHYYLTLELMGGGELFHQIVKLTYFSEELSRHVIMQVASGIQYLHQVQGVVHRDIKPENILFEAIPIIPSKHPKTRPYDEEKEDEGEFLPGIGGGGIGRIKIADFGLSKIVWNEDTMTPCGTVGYTAPEIVKDERYTTSVDMWALGCVLYTLECGFPPFYDESINVLTEKVAKGYYTFLAPWWDDISGTSKDLITHLLEVDPAKRYTISEFLAHPWCNEKPEYNALTPGRVEAIAPNLKPIPKYNLPLDSPLLAGGVGGGRRALPSPGIASLKASFDISYAINRIEEESHRRRRAGGAGGRAGFLAELNEEEDDEDEAQDLELTKRRYGAEVSAAIEEKRRVTQQEAATGTGRPVDGNATYQGWGGADRKMAEAALYDGRAGPRDRGKKDRKAGFELTLNNATLLGRRKDPHPMSLNLPPTHLVPGSPMRVD